MSRGSLTCGDARGGGRFCALAGSYSWAMAPHIRTVKTSSGARAVQIVYSNRGGKRTMEHVGSAHDDGELELLKDAARQRISAGQGELELPGLEEPAAGGPLPIRSSRMGHLVDALCAAYRALGFEDAAGGDIETSTGMSIKKFVTTTRRYREVVIAAGDQLITAADPIPGELRQAINAISEPRTAH